MDIFDKLVISITWVISLVPQYPIRLILNGQASKEIEWHCKHYVGRGLMKRLGSGEALANEMGLDPKVLARTFEDYNTSVRTKKDPFGKKVSQLSLLSCILQLLSFYSSSKTVNGR